jgi:hypothetical protein
MAVSPMPGCRRWRFGLGHRAASRADSGGRESGRYSRQWRRSAWPPRCSRHGGEARCGVLSPWAAAVAGHDDAPSRRRADGCSADGPSCHTEIAMARPTARIGRPAPTSPQAKPTSAGNISPPSQRPGLGQGTSEVSANRITELAPRGASSAPGVGVRRAATNSARLEDQHAERSVARALRRRSEGRQRRGVGKEVAAGEAAEESCLKAVHGGPDGGEAVEFVRHSWPQMPP